MRVDICIPIYNEEQVIKQSVKQVIEFCEKNLVRYDWRLVLVINGSSDQSTEIAKSLSKENNKIHLEIFPEGGRGRALKRAWLSSSADIVSYMDADLAVKLEALTTLIDSVADGSADLSIGNRFLPESKVRRSLFREIQSRTYSLLARLILGHTQKDLQCGFKAIKREIFLSLKDKILDPIWFFDTELIIWAQHFKYHIAEIPVDWHDTRLGKRPSKVHSFFVAMEFIGPLLTLRKRIKHYKSSV